VEEDEELMDAARRELVEETGLAPAKLHRVDYSYSYPVAEKWRSLYAPEVQEITEVVFVAEVEGQQAPLLDGREHDQWQWCSIDQALQRLLWPGNIEALRHCARYLQDRPGLV
jgi:8-oxo-dGTP pyrophosphatase MutT (NUDIX family)